MAERTIAIRMLTEATAGRAGNVPAGSETDLPIHEALFLCTNGWAEIIGRLTPDDLDAVLAKVVPPSERFAALQAELAASIRQAVVDVAAGSPNAKTSLGVMEQNATHYVDAIRPVYPMMAEIAEHGMELVRLLLRHCSGGDSSDG